jgi:hypothetical protein
MSLESEDDAARLCCSLLSRSILQIGREVRVTGENLFDRTNISDLFNLAVGVPLYGGHDLFGLKMLFSLCGFLISEGQLIPLPEPRPAKSGQNQ